MSLTMFFLKNIMIVVEWFCNCDSMIPYHMVEWVHCSKHNGLFHWLTYLMIAAVTCNIIHIINGISWRNAHNLCGAMIMLICPHAGWIFKHVKWHQAAMDQTWGTWTGPKKANFNFADLKSSNFLGQTLITKKCEVHRPNMGTSCRNMGTVDGGHFNFFSVPSQKWCSAIPVAFLMFGSEITNQSCGT